MQSTEKFKFTKGQRIHLDDIYNIQGLGTDDGEWWESDKDDGDELVVIQDIEIIITIIKNGPKQ